MKKIIGCFIFILLFFCGSVRADGASNIVNYDSNQAKFTGVLNNFFSDLSSAVPGSEHSDSFIIRNRGNYETGFYFGIEAMEQSEEMEEMLRRIELTITDNNKPANTIFHGNLTAAEFQDKNGKPPIHLGDLPSNRQMIYNFNFELDITLDNRFINALSNVRWEYFAMQEDIPDETTPPSSSEEPPPDTSFPEELPKTSNKVKKVIKKTTKKTEQGADKKTIRRNIRRHIPRRSSLPNTGSANRLSATTSKNGFLPNTGEEAIWWMTPVGLCLLVGSVYRLRFYRKK